MPGKSNVCPVKGKQRIKNNSVWRRSRYVRPAVEEIEKGQRMTKATAKHRERCISAPNSSCILGFTRCRPRFCQSN